MNAPTQFPNRLRDEIDALERLTSRYVETVRSAGYQETPLVNHARLMLLAEIRHQFPNIDEAFSEACQNEWIDEEGYPLDGNGETIVGSDKAIVFDHDSFARQFGERRAAA